MIQKLVKLKRRLVINHDKCITTPEFNNLAAGVFTERLARANLITKTDLILNYKVSIKKLTQIKQSICLLRMN